MIPANWMKVFKDIWSNKTRSILVILSIAVGIAAVGMINIASWIIERDLYGQYASGNPARVYIYVAPFEKELAKSVEGMREVETADARRILSALIITQDSQREDLNLIVVPDYSNVRINRFQVVEGAKEPGVRQILMERQSAQLLGLNVGDQITIEMENKQRYTLTIAGIVHDVYEMPFALLGEATAYVNMSTLEWMGERPFYNRLDIVVSEQKSDKAHVLKVGEQIRDRVIEPAGLSGVRIQIPGVGSEPGDHWAHNQINGFLLILKIMGVMAMLLSSGLVINTISAILVQQVKQIGILRAVGATRRQVINTYLLYVIILGVLGLMIALPLGLIGSWGLANLAAYFLNFDLSNISLPWDVLAVQVTLSLVVPVGVALVPIFSSTRIPVYDAIYQYGLSNKGVFGKLEGLLGRFRTFDPPLLLSLRNTFRKKARLAFTLGTLTLAGAMFIASFSTYTSLNSQIRDVERYISFDVSLGIPGGASKTTIEREARRVTGVAYAEGWALSEGVLERPDGSESQGIEIVGLPPDARTIQPLLLDGEWLAAGNFPKQVVVNQDLVNDEPQIKVGNLLDIKVGDKKQTFSVVGIVSKHLSGARIYMNGNTFAQLTGRRNQADVVRVVANLDHLCPQDIQESISINLEKRFDNAGFSSERGVTRHSVYDKFTKVFNIILIVLLIMAGLLAVVGSIGLTGALGINVLERVREIGILRAVGAANQAVLKIVMIEGVVVSMISWVMGALTSALSSPFLAGVVIYAVLNTRMKYRYSLAGLAIWFGLILLIGVVASLAPARKAALLQVRDVLDYE